ncbi:GNAT family N-acetyltransferase [Shimia thalassica]|uniref:GNAT family N-acetyltransferase n=1 Tax=Shimia thalassica TaxID=1715693 RepID=UPI0024941539|nr:GNAT family N-acetyltransferase [Shimia thalassica]
MTPELLAQIHGAAFRESRGWSASEFQSLLSSPFCFVVGDQTGFALGRVIVDEVELLTIAVLPDHQGQGLGAKWLLAFETAARAKGAETAFLEVAEDNVAAISLYARQGYTTQSTRTGYYSRADGQKIDARIMSHNLG